MSHDVHQFTIKFNSAGEDSATEAARVRHDRVKNRLHISRRARDHPKDLARGRLLLQRLLRLVEQPHVLDRNGRLVGEGLHQGDLTLGKRQNLVALDADGAQQFARPEDGDRKQGPEPGAAPIRVLWIALDIVYVNRSSLEGGAPRAALSSGRDRIPLDELSLRRREVARDHGSEKVTVEAEDRRVAGLAQSDRVLGQGLKDGLEIERGPADHLEQFTGRRLLLPRLDQLMVVRLKLFERVRLALQRLR